jgi:hypothetical protein
MTREEIIEKIKKLLRMKRGGTAGEIANALAAAAKLAREHSIDLGSVDPDAPDAVPLSHMDAKTAARLQDECKYAALVCQNFFNVTAMITDAKNGRRWRDWQIIFIGTTTDQQSALYIFEFLSGHFRRCWNHRPNKRLKNRPAFMNGIFQGLCQKLHEQRKAEVTGVGLVRLDQAVARRDQYLKAHWPDAGTRKMEQHSDASAAKWAGWVEGRKTEIRSGLDGAPAARPQLQPARVALPPPAGQMELI